jgi:hypothetical protein
VDLAGMNHEIDSVVGHQRTEALGDTSQFELQRDLQNRFGRRPFQRILRGSTWVLPPQGRYIKSTVISAGWAR